MALDARTRSSILDSLVPVMGEHNANALMSEFPSVEADELVTKQFLRAELAEFRAEMRDQWSSEIGSVRTDVASLRTEMMSEMASFRTEMMSAMASFRTEMVDRFHQQSVRFGVALAGAVTLQTAVLGTLISLG